MSSNLEQLRARLADRYAVERELGRGGMGAVYLARDRRLDRYVALKVLPPDYAATVSLRERFLRETRTAASFSHPNIVPVYAIEEADDLLAFVMGYIEGETLAERVRRSGRLSVRETVRLLQDVGYALAYAHGRGVVHRDIKPDNIMIERATGRALVMDFGVARAIAAPAGGAGLTRVGEVVGTPEYMSPEQATGDVVDGRSDLYSLGLTAYFALTGRTAMTADSAAKVLVKQITEILPPISTIRPDLPAPLGEAIDRCVVKEPSGRFANAESLVEALDAAQLTGPEIPLAIRLFAQDVSMLMTVLLLAGLIGVMAWGRVESSADRLLPILALFGVLATRVMQTFGDARRLAVAGFTPENVERGFAAVLDEREQRRTELRTDPATLRARRRSVRSGVVLIALSVLLARAALFFRHQVGPLLYQTSIPGVLLIFAAAVMFGTGVALLLRSPLRVPPNERLFRWIWLGPIGRAFIRIAARGVARPEAGVTIASRSGGVTPHDDAPISAAAASAAPIVTGAAVEDRLAALEIRVTALERDRRDSYVA